MKNQYILPFFSVYLFLVTSCTNFVSDTEGPLFRLIPSEQSLIEFENRLTSTNEFNIYKYRNFYNGGGVGLGDVNNDGLPDIYLTANMESNKLYLNRGNWEFEEVTEQAGVGGKRAWSTGVSMTDINGDGWLDIYVCNSGDVAGDNKENEFFINNGDGTFTDRAEELGLADHGFSTHAAFFDYDKDGDLDIYVLNNSYRSIGSFNLKENERPIRDSLGGDKLYRNDGPGTTSWQFTDVSEKAGIYGSVIGFGLGVVVSDLDKDGWQDLYISNDFFERDYLYLNNGDGTFREELESQMQSISNASMGVDAADLNGDGAPEIFVNDMLPEGEERFKTTMTFENWDKYRHNLEHDYYHQFTRNTLHLNQGVVPGKGLHFSEIGRLAGVEATDWSWSVLLADLDNNGQKDLYITNGIYQDILNQDFIQYIASEEVARMVITDEGVNYKELIDIIPSNRIPNYAYSGHPDLQFENKTEDWGLATPSHSSGAAYGDLDNDGDLDLVVNNVNMPLFLYENTSDLKLPDQNYLKVELKGAGKNTLGVGAKVSIRSGSQQFYQEQYPNRGFQSSVDPRLNFGLGAFDQADTLEVIWPSGKFSLLTGISANQTIVIKESDAQLSSDQFPANGRLPLFTELSQSLKLPYRHRENDFVDFDLDGLLYHMKSTEGPKMTTGDVNGDGLIDLFIGGAKDQAGALYLQTADGRFQAGNNDIFVADQASEDLDNLFFDADGDGDLDLYVVSGGNEFSSSAYALVDRLYFNDGRGHFQKSSQALPSFRPESTSSVAAADFDGDNDLDLFVGTRLKPRLYGVPQSSYLLENDGTGHFRDVTKEKAPALQDIGLVTDGIWTDYDQDGDPDLIVVGEWMPVKLFNNEAGKLQDISATLLPEKTKGWWNTVSQADLNGDGFPDLLLGNHGLNSRFRASPERPISCYINDFDQNGTVEQILCQYNGTESYPQVLRHDLVKQLPHLKKKYLKYEDYQGKTIQDLFDTETINRSIVHEAHFLESALLLSDGKGGFSLQPLPRAAQLAPIFAFSVYDFDSDGILDIVLGGNLYHVKPEVGRYDASYGLLLKGLGEGRFTPLNARESGFFSKGEIRDMVLLEDRKEPLLVVARNNDSLQIFSWKKTGHPEL